METQPRKDLLQKLIDLEKSQKHLEQETSWLQISKELRQGSRRNISEGAPAWRKSGFASFRHALPLLKESRNQDSINLGQSAGKFTDKQYLNILQSMGQSIHVFDLESRIIFWNAMAEKIYGYSAAEVVGRNPVNLVVDERDLPFANKILQNCYNGESWSGEFPVRRKSGERISAVTTVSPFYDDEGSLVGIISLTSNSAQYLHPRNSLAKLKEEDGETSTSLARNSFTSKPRLDSKGAVISKLGLDSHQPIQVAIASKISSLVSKVRSKMRAGDSSVTLSEGGSGGSHYSEHDLFSAASGASTPRGDFIHSPFGVFTYENNKPINTEAYSLWSSSLNANNTSSTSSCRSTNSSDTDSDCLEDENLWDDNLTIGERIRQAIAFENKVFPMTIGPRNHIFGQVIGTVGFMNQRLEIPKDIIDPCWISLMESCWHSDTKLRPTFHELVEKLREVYNAVPSRRMLHFDRPLRAYVRRKKSKNLEQLTWITEWKRKKLTWKRL